MPLCNLLRTVNAAVVCNGNGHTVQKQRKQVGCVCVRVCVCACVCVCNLPSPVQQRRWRHHSHRAAAQHQQSDQPEMMVGVHVGHQYEAHMVECVWPQQTHQLASGAFTAIQQRKAAAFTQPDVLCLCA